MKRLTASARKQKTTRRIFVSNINTIFLITLVDTSAITGEDQAYWSDST